MPNRTVEVFLMKAIIAMLLLSTRLGAFADCISPLQDGTGANHIVAPSKAGLLSFFDSAKAQGTNGCLKVKAQGARHFCIANGRGDGTKLSSDGKTIVLSEGGKLSLHSDNQLRYGNTKE